MVLMFETLATVAPSSRDKQLLKQMMKQDRTAERGLVSDEASSGDQSLDLVDDPLEAVEHAFLRYRHEWRPSNGGERLLARFADRLYEENNERLAPIRLEAQLFRIQSRLDFPVDQNSVVVTQRFLQAYLQRRGPRALYSAFFKTVKRAAIVEDTYETAVAIRNRYLNFTTTYGDFEKQSVREDVETSLGELAEQNEAQFVPDETIGEELERRRLGVQEESFNPFKKGRISVRASFTDWVQVVWKTPNLEVKAAPKKVRMRIGGRISGFDISSYTSARYKGWKGRSGFEVMRPLDTHTRLALNAGINFGREDEDQVEDLVDVFTLTNDSSYIYLSLERLF